MNFGYEGITDDGYLHDPYRSARYLDPTSAKGYSYEAEVTPGTKTSSAWAIRGMYYLPYRASARAEYRYYNDTWGVEGWNIEFGYVQPLSYGVTLDLNYRYYTQGASRLLQRPVSVPELAELPESRQGAVGVLVELDRRRADVRVRHESRAVLQTRRVQPVRRLHPVHVRRLSRRAEGRRTRRRAAVHDGLDDHQGVRLVLVLKSKFRIASV